MPSRSSCSSSVSRVVPATSVTMARSRASSRLNSDDLPALGRPTMTSVGAVAHQPAGAEAVQQLPARGLARRAIAAAKLPGGQVGLGLVHELHRRLGPRDPLLQRLAQRPDPLRDRALGLGEGDPGLVQRPRAHQVADRLGAGQVQPAVAQRSVGELAGPGRHARRAATAASTSSASTAGLPWAHSSAVGSPVYGPVGSEQHQVAVVQRSSRPVA